MRVLRNILAILFIILFFVFPINKYYKFHIFDFQFFPLLNRTIINFSLVALGLFLFLIILTLIFGRIYCSFLCPLGLFQEIIFYIFKPISKLNKKYNFKFEKNKIYKYFIASIFYGSLLGGSVFLAKFLEPYTLYVSATSFSKTSLIIVLFILLLGVFKSRLFCTNICPVGTLLGLISRYSLFKVNVNKEKCVKCGICQRGCQSNSIDIKNQNINNETCVKCLKCLGACKKNAITYGKNGKEKKDKNNKSFSEDRRKFLVGALSLGVFFLTFKRISYKVKNEIGRVKNIILPPGGRSNKEFVNNCLNCNLCVKNCPQQIIKKKDETFGAVHLDLTKNFCKFDCHTCSNVCPAGALKKLSLSEKQQTKIANAQINTSECIQCGLCLEACPKKAISKIDGEFPNVDSTKCIGCGKCALECPIKTIKIEGIEEQENSL